MSFKAKLSKAIVFLINSCKFTHFKHVFEIGFIFNLKY